MRTPEKTRFDYSPAREVEAILQRAIQADPDLNLQAHIDRYILLGHWAANLTDLQPPRFHGRSRQRWRATSGTNTPK